MSGFGDFGFEGFGIRVDRGRGVQHSYEVYTRIVAAAVGVAEGGLWYILIAYSKQSRLVARIV